MLAAALVAACTTVQSRDPRANAHEVTELRGDTVFYLTDHHDSPVVLADARGAILEHGAQHAYGAERGPLSDRPTWSFTGNELDATELGNFHARPYDARLGRFLAVDPEPLFQPNAQLDPRAFGAYAYAAGDPVNQQDPSGRSLWTKVIKVGVKVWKTGNALDAFADNVQDAITVFDSSASTFDRVVAGVSLASELLPASVGDVKDAAQWVGVVGDAKKIEKKVTQAGGVPTPTAGQKVYRVYGGDAKPGGASWTPDEPGDNYRDLAGLPSGGPSGANNSGRFVIEGTLQDPAAVVKTRRALPLDGTRGGANEYIIPNPIESGAVRVDRVSGSSPEF